MDTDDWTVVGLSATIVIAIIAAVCWYEWKYPCLKYEDRIATCGGGMYCAGYTSKGNCMVWMTHPTYQCTQTVCVQRGERVDVEAQ
jgi:hypothetical protein